VADTARYDRVSQWLHWLVAALAVVVVALAWMIPEAARHTAWRDLVLLLHRSIGIVILAAMLVRALWRWQHKPPPLPASVRPVEAWLAHANHFGLYVLFVGMPLTGYVNAAAAGHPVSLFGLAAIPPLFAADPHLSQLAIALHQSGQFLIYALVAGHVAAALLHAVVHRDGVLERMLPRRRKPI
jgi:cytochrome b561